MSTLGSAKPGDEVPFSLPDLEFFNSILSMEAASTERYLARRGLKTMRPSMLEPSDLLPVVLLGGGTVGGVPSAGAYIGGHGPFPAPVTVPAPVPVMVWGLVTETTDDGVYLRLDASPRTTWFREVMTLVLWHRGLVGPCTAHTPKDLGGLIYTWCGRCDADLVYDRGSGLYVEDKRKKTT